MPGDVRYTEGHATCRESLICMINKKLSRGVFIGVMIAMIGIPSTFILYALAAEQKQHEKIAEQEKKMVEFNIKQDAVLTNQKLFRHDLNQIRGEHKIEMNKLHDKMDEDKKDIIKEIRRMHK